MLLIFQQIFKVVKMMGDGLSSMMVSYLKVSKPLMWMISLWEMRKQFFIESGKSSDSFDVRFSVLIGI